MGMITRGLMNDGDLSKPEPSKLTKRDYFVVYGCVALVVLAIIFLVPLEQRDKSCLLNIAEWECQDREVKFDWGLTYTPDGFHCCSEPINVTSRKAYDQAQYCERYVFTEEDKKMCIPKVTIAKQVAFFLHEKCGGERV